MANIYNIYKITNNIDNKIYIVSTSQILVERFMNIYIMQHTITLLHFIFI